MIIFISWKNVWRNKLRSSIVIMAIAIGLFGGIFTNAFFMGMTQQRVDSAIKNETANLQIHHPDFLVNETIDKGIPQSDNLLSRIASLPQVKGVSARLTETGMAATAENNAGVFINGINPDAEKQVTSIHEKIEEGKYPAASDKIPILIGRKLAKKLNAKPGDKIVLSFANSLGEVSYGAFKVIGIYNTQNDMFDGIQVFVLTTHLQPLLKTPDNYATEIAISLKNNEETSKIKAELQKIFKEETTRKEIVVQDWKEIDPTLDLMIQSMDYFAWFFIAIILIALAFGIVNTMIMVVMERVQEIGMLMAIGMNKSRVFAMILWETIFLSVTGAAIGIAASVITLGYFQSEGLDLSLFSQGMNAYGLNSLIFPYTTIGFYLKVTLMVFVTAVAASVFPARFALKLQPAEAIRL